MGDINKMDNDGAKSSAIYPTILKQIQMGTA